MRSDGLGGDADFPPLFRSVPPDSLSRSNKQLMASAGFAIMETTAVPLSERPPLAVSPPLEPRLPHFWKAEAEERTPSFEWTRSDVATTVLEDCSECGGIGLIRLRGGKTDPCKCVLRGIFRQCHRRYVTLSSPDRMGGVSVSRFYSHQRSTNGTSSSKFAVLGRKNEEYLADFEIVARRALGPNEHRLFRACFILGDEWSESIGRQFGLSRGNFFHGRDRIAQKLGRAFREVLPYSLFPLNEYFGSARRAAREGRKQ